MIENFALGLIAWAGGSYLLIRHCARAGQRLNGHVPPPSSPSAVRVVPNARVFDFERDS